MAPQLIREQMLLVNVFQDGALTLFRDKAHIVDRWKKLLSAGSRETGNND